MKQYGLKITRKDGSKLEVYYHSLTYRDWSLYSSAEEMFEPATIRYLINTYVIRVINKGEDAPVSILLDEDVSIIQQVVSALGNKSVFNDEDAFLKILGNLETRSRTLIGCYDLFIFLKMGPEFYLHMLDQDAYTRAQIVMMVEKSTGITVKERFAYAVKKNIPLDIISDPDTYKKNIRKHGGPVPVHPHQRQNPMQEHHQTMQELQRNTENALPTTVDTMLSESRSALEQALHAGRKKAGKKSAFNWGQDEVEFNQFNQE